MSTEAPLKDRPRQEPSDIQPRTVLLTIGGVVVMVVVAALVAHLLSQLGGPARNSPENQRVARDTRLESSPGGEITTFERMKSERLNSYGWVDPQHQIAHIPVEVALQKLAERNKTERSRP